MSDDFFIGIVMYFIWIAICTSNAIILKVLRWILMALFVFTPSSEMGVDLSFKIIAFVVIFAPVIFKKLIRLIICYRRV